MKKLKQNFTINEVLEIIQGISDACIENALDVKDVSDFSKGFRAALVKVANDLDEILEDTKKSL